jgi:hypothetical protein
MVTFAATYTIFSGIGKAIGDIPVPTPLDIPNALRRLNKTDKTFASSSATIVPKASPDGN